MASIWDTLDERREAVRRIIRKYQPNPADIDELEQEVFLRFHTIERESPVQKPENLMKRLAKRLAINRAARARTARNLSIEEIGGPQVLLDEETVEQDTLVSDAQRLRIVEAALEQVSGECRTALLMRRVDGMAYKQIAQELGISVSAVEKRVANALLDLQLNLRKAGYDPLEFGCLPARKSASTKSDRTRLASVSASSKAN